MNESQSISQTGETNAEVKFSAHIFREARRFIIVTCILSAIVILVFISFFYIKWGQTISDDIAKWGTFGDYIGGVIGSILAFTTIVLIYKSLSLQMVEFQKLSKSQRDTVSMLKLQTFESKFFSLLELHHTIVDGLRGELMVLDRDKDIFVREGFESREFIFKLVESFVHIKIISDQGSGSDRDWVEKIKQVLKNERFRFMHYISNIDTIINMVISEFPQETTEKAHLYFSMLKAQLSNPEVIIIGYYLKFDNLEERTEKFVKTRVLADLDLEWDLPEGHSPLAIVKLLPEELIKQLRDADRVARNLIGSG